MRRLIQFLIAIVILSFGAAPSRAISEVITPVGVIATSEFGAVEFFGISDVFVEDLIDGGGLIDVEETPDNVLDDLHDNDGTWMNGWHSGDFDAGIPGGVDGDGDPFTAPLVDDQVIEFDLGGLFVVTHAHIWQQNQSGFESALAPDRGVEEFEIHASTSDSGENFVNVGTYTLEFEDGAFEVPAQVVEPVDPIIAKRIRFDLNSAFSGLDNEFVGLAEVRFEGERVPEVEGDFNGDQELNALDIDLLTNEVRAGTNNAAFDLTGDSIVNRDDRTRWVEELKQTYFGDSNLDGEFNSSDFVVVFTAGEYEDGVDDNSTWADGDWNGDGDFDSTDFVSAFTSGGYEKGPRVGLVAVPEPSFPFVMIILGLWPMIRNCPRRDS